VLVISDVIGDELSVIGSGPFTSDPSTFRQCREILQRSSIWDRAPATVREVIAAGEKGDIPETPKREWENIRHYLIGTNRLALDGAARCARDHALPAHILTSSLAGEAREVARVLVSLARNISLTGQPFPPPCCLLFGGETTVTVRGSGSGGRNQELALAALAELRPEENILLLSGGTDGIDGNSSAAGALADRDLLGQAADLGLSINRFLDDNNANEFFRRTGGLLETGPTGTNVMDITLIIIDKEDV
jgi:hydroxypyruvate reductase/glycerate 2-kinase